MAHVIEEGLYKALARNMNATADIRPLTMVSLYSVSEAMMLVAVAVASPGTINLEGTYRLNAPNTTIRKYSNPAILPRLPVRISAVLLTRGGPQAGARAVQAVDILQPRDVDCQRV